MSLTKIMAYEVRNDERPYFEATANKYQIDICCTEATLTLETLQQSKGKEGISILGHSQVNAALLDQIQALGIQHLSTRTIGFNHIDIDHARNIGLKISNTSYDPDGVAEFTIMMILMALRHYKAALYRANVNDYSLSGLLGKELRNCTVGVMGTGSIGKAVIKNLQGFGCRVLAYSRNASKKKFDFPGVEIVDAKTLIKNSDIITMHVPVNEQTYHFINEKNLSELKDGAILINCSRGGLFDSKAMIKGIESKKIGAIALDVFENETGVYHFDRRSDIISNRDMAYLRQFPNVIMTQHMAFYTDIAIEKMVSRSIENIYFDTNCIF